MSQPGKGHPKGLYVLFFTEMWEEVDEIAKDRRDVRKVCAVHACAVPRGMGLRA